MAISAETVKDLREKTGAGMLDCKKALEESQGDVEKAIEFLRKKGLSQAAKKSARTAAEGILGHHYNSHGKIGALVEINCETDFVARNDQFLKFVDQTMQQLIQEKPKDLDTFLKAAQPTVTELVAKIGENIQIRRFVLWETASPQEKIGFYLHAGNKIGVMVRFADPDGKLTPEAMKEVAMHVAAMNPLFVRRDEVPAAVLEKEREIQRAQIDTKKPVEIQNKIIEGKLNRYFADNCLEEQVFVKDPEGKKTVSAWIKTLAPQSRMLQFVRYQVGEGLKN